MTIDGMAWLEYDKQQQQQQSTVELSHTEKFFLLLFYPFALFLSLPLFNLRVRI